MNIRMIEPPHTTQPDWEAISTPFNVFLFPRCQAVEIDCLALFFDHERHADCFAVPHNDAPAIISEIVEGHGLSLVLDGREVLAAGGRATL